MHEARIEKALEAGFAAFRATFKAVYAQNSDTLAVMPPKGANRARATQVKERYAPDSWKRHVLEIVESMLQDGGGKSFRFAAFTAYEKHLKRLHPEHDAIMSGISVTLQGLIKDGVVRRTARGVYELI